MAEKRRRRILEDEGEESAPDKDSELKGRPSECESEGDPAEVEIVSEYGSAAEDSKNPGADEETEEGSEEETEEETEEGSDEEEEYTDEEDVIVEDEHIDEERQSGDGEEQPDKENVDDDEDKKNPAYVPRKGAFYEHDMRTGEDDVPEKDLKPKKKLWQDEGKWTHDRFRDDLQAPKSREELIALYGYDIRTSDKPPDAPPPRRGRGRGRGRPQRSSQLSEFIEPEQLKPQQPEPPQQEYQRMAVIDTTDYGQRRSKQGPPPARPPPDSFEDFEEDIDVPFMTTIDTSKSSANDYHLRGQRRGGRGGPGVRGHRERGGHYGDNQQSHSDLANSERQTFNGDRRGGRNGPPSWPNASQDVRLSQAQEAPGRQDKYGQDFPSLGRPNSGGSGGRGYRQEKFPRDRQFRSGQEETRDNYNSPRHSHPSNSYGRGGVRGDGFSKPARGNGRDMRNDRPPRYSRMEREDRPSSMAGDLVPTGREFTNSSYKPGDKAGIVGNTIQDEVPGQPGRQTSQDVVISNKENVQTISVTITNTTTERKSYAKERRGKNAALHGAGDEALGAGDQGKGPIPMLEAPPSAVTSSGDHVHDYRPHEKRNQGGMGPRGQQLQQQQQEQNRPKRYSSQRQRNMIELGYGDPHQQTPPMPQPSVSQHQQKMPPPPQLQPQHKSKVPLDANASYFKPGVFPPPPPPPPGHPAAPPLFRPEMAGGQRPSHPPPPTPQDAAAAYSTAMLHQPPISFHMQVTSPGMPSPPRLMGPNMAGAPPGPVPVPVPIGNTTPQLLTGPYMTPGVIYTTPPPMPGAASAQYQVPMGYTSPPPTAPPPTLAQPPVVSPQTQPEVHRGGTVYFPPYLQQPSQGRSAARRPKAAIPIVNPTELKKKDSVDNPTTPTTEGGNTEQGLTFTAQPEGGKDTATADVAPTVQADKAPAPKLDSSPVGIHNKVVRDPNTVVEPLSRNSVQENASSDNIPSSSSQHPPSSSGNISSSSVPTNSLSSSVVPEAKPAPPQTSPAALEVSLASGKGDSIDVPVNKSVDSPAVVSSPQLVISSYDSMPLGEVATKSAPAVIPALGRGSAAEATPKTEPAAAESQLAETVVSSS